MKSKLKPYLFLLPSVLSFLFFVIGPFLYTFYLSFFEWNMIKPVKKFVGLQNYRFLFHDPILWDILGNTLIYILLLLLFNLMVPYLLAYLLNFVIQKGRNFYRSAFFLPSVISLVIGSVLYTWILNPVSGPIAIIFRHFGGTLPIWTKTEGWVIVVLSIITSWKVFGYNFIVLFGSVCGVNSSVIEAARLDGCTNTRIFLDIVLPMSSATGIYVFIITIVQGLQFVFTPIKVITQGGPNYASSNLIYQSYHEAFVLYRTGTASALSMITMIIFIVLLALEFKFVERRIYYEN